MGQKSMFSEPYMNMGDTNYDDTQINQTIHERDENEDMNEKSFNSDSTDGRKGSIRDLEVKPLEQ